MKLAIAVFIAMAVQLCLADPEHVISRRKHDLDSCVYVPTHGYARWLKKEEIRDHRYLADLVKEYGTHEGLQTFADGSQPRHFSDTKWDHIKSLVRYLDNCYNLAEAKYEEERDRGFTREDSEDSFTREDALDRGDTSKTLSRRRRDLPDLVETSLRDLMENKALFTEVVGDIDSLYRKMRRSGGPKTDRVDYRSDSKTRGYRGTIAIDSKPYKHSEAPRRRRGTSETRRRGTSEPPRRRASTLGGSPWG